MTQIRIIVVIASFICVLMLMPTATAHGGSALFGAPSWILLIGSVLGLWVIIGGGVILIDRLLRDILGSQ